MIYFDLGDSPYIELIKLLKAENIASSGAEAKMIVEDNLVKVNGEVETRKRAKLKENDIVTVEDWSIQVIRK